MRNVASYTFYSLLYLVLAHDIILRMAVKEYVELLSISDEQFVKQHEIRKQMRELFS